MYYVSIHISAHVTAGSEHTSLTLRSATDDLGCIREDPVMVPEMPGQRQGSLA